MSVHCCLLCVSFPGTSVREHHRGCPSDTQLQDAAVAWHHNGGCDVAAWRRSIVAVLLRTSLVVRIESRGYVCCWKCCVRCGRLLLADPLQSWHFERDANCQVSGDTLPGCRFVATDAGVTRLSLETWTLARKAAAFEAVLLARHDRHGLTSECSMLGYGTMTADSPWCEHGIRCLL
jgi:hypothetical protein